MRRREHLRAPREKRRPLPCLIRDAPPLPWARWTVGLAPWVQASAMTAAASNQGADALRSGRASAPGGETPGARVVIPADCPQSQRSGPRAACAAF